MLSRSWLRLILVSMLLRLPPIKMMYYRTNLFVSVFESTCNKESPSWSSLSIPISRARASLRSLDALGYCQPLHSQAKPQHNDGHSDNPKNHPDHSIQCLNYVMLYQMKRRAKGLSMSQSVRESVPQSALGLCIQGLLKCFLLNFWPPLTQLDQIWPSLHGKAV